MKARISRAAVASVALALAAVALPASPAQASPISDRPCDTTDQLAKKELKDKVNGRTALLGTLYVFKEGRQLCAVTTSTGTLWDGVRKPMGVALKVGGRTWADPFDWGVATNRPLSSFAHYAGRIRLPHTGGCFVAWGAVILPSGDRDDETVSGRVKGSRSCKRPKRGHPPQGT